MESISNTTKNDRKVLIVEDDELLNDGLCYHLQKNGYHPVPAYTLEQADTLLETEAWELFLLDINFPDGNGLRFAKELRKHSPAPIMFLTAQDMDEDVIRGFEAGADDYITKPFNIKILMQRIQAVLKRYHLSQTPTSSPPRHTLKNASLITPSPSPHRMVSASSVQENLDPTGLSTS